MTDAPSAWSLIFLLGACGTQSGNSGGGTPLGPGSGGSGDSDGSAANGSGASGSSSSATGVGGFGMASAEAGTSAPDATQSDASASNDGALVNTEGGESGAPMPFIGCDRNAYPLCLDFEKGADPKWTGITWTGAGAGVQSGKAAHGMNAFHFPPGGLITTRQLGTITNVLWGRLYLHMTPGAPVGHGELVGVYDQSGNWYELGYEFNGLQGNWHGNGGEKYMRTKTKIPDQYVCVEFLFDGATPLPAQIWMDGQLIQYYDIGKTAGPNKVTQFDHIEVGFRPFHSLSLVTYDGQTPPLMTEMWIDDIAFDVKRIGCL